MKQCIAIIVLVLLLKPVVPVLDYIINYDFIAKELCENKAKPQMHCNGKCHLKKELAKAAEGEKSSSGKKNVQQEADLILMQPVVYFVAAPSAVFPDTNFHYLNLYGSRSGYAVFHPPLIVC